MRVTARPRRLLVAAGLAIGAAALITGFAFADGGTVDVQVANSTLCKDGTTSAGARIFYEGKDCVDYGSSGTGVFNSFVRVQASPQESGYNTDGTLEFDTSGGTWTRAILVSEIPVVKIAGQEYWELFSDINDGNGGTGSQIQLTDLEVWFTSNASLTGYGASGFPSGATKQYDFAGNILINDVNSGSGRGDLRYDIPLSGITLPANCGYFDSGCSTYFVLYSKWGDAAGGVFSSDGGFEEWKVKQYPTIELKKAWVGQPGQTTLNIGTSIGGSQVDTQLTGANGTPPLTTGTNIAGPGTFYVSETGGLTGYTTTLACTRDGTAFTPGANGAVTFTNTQNKIDTSHVVCTFTNTAIPPKLHLRKIVVNDNNGTATVANFTLTADGTGSNDLSGTSPVDSGASLLPDTWTLSETNVAGYTASGWVCIGGSQGDATHITLGVGGEATCTITNNDVDAQIDVSPLTATNPVNQAHTITATVQQDDGIAAGAPGDAVTGFGPAPNGTTVTFSLLNNTAGAAFVGGVNTCTTTAGSCSVQINSSTPGGVDIHATTTFSVGGVSLTRATGSGGLNSADAHKDYVAGTIIIRKTTVPAGGTGFGFTTTGGLTPSTFSLNDGQNRTYPNLAPNSYSVTENDPTPGYDLTDIDCSATTGAGTSAVPDKATRSVAITLAAGGVVDCTYTNTKRGAIEVVKHTDPAGGTGFTFTGDAAGTIDDGGIITVPNLVPGTYTSTESVKTGWDLTALQCNDGASATPSTVNLGTRTATFKVDPGETVRCRFNNVQRGTIITRKATTPAGGTGFTFTGTNAGTIDDGGNITTSNLVPGTYTSVESAKTGWDLTALSCNDGASITPSTVSLANRTATFKLDPGETITCLFTNTQRATVKVTKTFKGGPIPAGKSFTFYLRQGASAGVNGTLLDTQVVTSATAQPFQLNGFLVAGTYQVCELAPGPGWNMTIANDPSVFTLDPLAADVVLCINVTLTPGQNLSLSFDNSPPPGGVALTIGYWKNHSSCKESKGKQAPVLDQTLALFPIAAGQTTHGFFVGDLYVDTCQEAYALLNKSTLTGTKVASDPAWNFASQYTAYLLNIQAGAGDIPAAAAAAAEGQAILDAHSFDGNTHTAFTDAEKATLNKDAGILDKFNNNTL